MSSKENFSACKLEGANLNVEPLQMKKKKKGGGYNVRKSLAWNKAFFTEEGVLDSDELSFIIGTPGNCSREVLSSISEESMHVPSDDLQSVGKNLFRDVPSASSKEAKNPVPFSLKHNSPASVHRATTSASSITVLSNHGFRRTGTRDSGSQPSLPLSSLKRPAKTHTFQSAMKGSKIPRTPVKNPGQSVVASTNRNAVGNASHVKQTQTAQPVSSIKRNVGVTASKRSTQVVPNKSKAGSETASHRKTNAVHVPISFPSPATLGPISSKMVNNSPPKATRDDAASFVVQSSAGPDESTAKGVSLPQNTLVTGTALQHRQMKSIKPSGLRLPSPSLGFFGQGTGNFRPVQPTVKVPGVPKPIHTKLMKSEDICCVSHNQIEQETVNESIKMEGSVLRDVCEHSEPRRDEIMTKRKNDFNKNLQFTVNQVAKCLTGENKAVEDALLVKSESSTDLTGDGIVNHEILDNEGHRESTGSDSEESKLARVASAADASGARSLNGSSCYKVEKNSRKSLLADDLVLMKSQSRDVFSCAVQCSSTTPITFVHDLYNPSKDFSEPNDVSPAEAFLVPHEVQHSSVEVGSFSEQVEDSQNLSCGKIANAYSRSPAGCELQMVKSELSGQSMNLNSSMNYSKREISVEPMFQESEIVADVILTPRRYQDNANECSQTSDINDPSGKGLTVKTANLEPIPRITDGLSASSCFLVEKGIVSKEILQNVMEKLPHAVTDICISELNTSDVQTTKARAGMQTGGGDVDDESGQDIVGDPVFCLSEIAPSVETYYHAHRESISCDFVQAIPQGLCSSSTESPKQSDAAEHGQCNASVITIDGPGKLTSLSSPCFDPCDGDNCCLTSDYIVLEEDKECHFHNVEKTDPNLQAYSGIGSVLPQTMAQLVNSGQAKTKENENMDFFAVSRTEDTLMQELGGKMPAECSSNHTPELSDHGELIAWSENSGWAELADSRIMVENVPQCSILRFGVHLSEDRTTSGEFESSIFESGADSVTKDAENGESDSIDSRTVSTVCLSENFIREDQYNVVNDSNSENATSRFMEVQTSTKLDKHLTWKHDEEPEDKDGLLVNEENDGLKLSGLSDETMSAVPEDIHRLVEEPHHSEMDTTLCTREDTDLIEPVCSEKTTSTSTKNTLKIIPTINAAPFSDEWLAAIEAAGEDILTIKSGAVQNSPTEKVVPEPRPWSPVKRRNNSVGPFDCTKFTSH